MRCSGDTTEAELCRVFSSYGNVKSTKIIVDRAGVSKGYGFVTFETEQEAQRLQADVCTYTIKHLKSSEEYNFIINLYFFSMRRDLFSLMWLHFAYIPFD